MVSEVVVGEELLRGLLEAARKKYPLEFFSLLGGRLRDGRAFVEEVIYVPWEEGYDHALFDTTLLPRNVLGTFHSHPGEPVPSPDDLSVFASTGLVHLIAGFPFTLERVRAYDREGKEVRLVIRGQRASF